MYILVMQRFIVVYYWISHESLVFVSGVHTSLKKSVYDKWDIRKRDIAINNMLKQGFH